MLKKIKTLVFDLDYTLYPSSTNIEKLFKVNIIDYLQKEMNMSVEEIEKAFEVFRKNASTLRGAKELGFDIERFFNYVCDVDVSTISYNETLFKSLSDISHQKIIYTNSNKKHMNQVLEKLKLEDVFHHKFTAEDSGYCFKPEAESFEKFFEYCKVIPQECAFFEDNTKNLEKAKSLGMTTILISAELNEKPEFCDYVFEDINQALKVFHK